MENPIKMADLGGKPTILGTPPYAAYTAYTSTNKILSIQQGKPNWKSFSPSSQHLRPCWDAPGKTSLHFKVLSLVSFRDGSIHIFWESV